MSDQQNTDSTPRATSNEYAIVGLACRMPGGCDTPQALWELLLAGRDAVEPIPADRWNQEGFYHPDPQVAGRSYVRSGGFIDHDTLARFDPGFFGIPPVQAQHMSPQQRLLLELAWEGLEDGGVRPDRIAGGRVGVYIGICNDHYGELQNEEPAAATAFTNSGGAMSIAANRISHVFDLRGPSIAVDTACSSSLIALHLATTAMNNGDCDMALVGGVSLILRPKSTIGFCKSGMLARSERCRSFSADGDGFVRSEGAAIAVLEPLAQARAAGRRIYAVVCGTAANTCGHTPGISQPSQAAQEDLLRSAVQRSGVNPQAIAYFEAHGTGTRVGDPIEAGALGAVLGKKRSRPLLVGSVKSNIGHLEGASGMAGLLKLCLAMRHGRLPAQLHCETLNPDIDFAGLHLMPVRTEQAWPDRGVYAGISSFGFGGANACAILRQETPRSASAAAAKPRIGGQFLPLSARSPEALQAQARRLYDRLRRPEAPDFGDCLLTLGAYRTHHEHRAALCVESLAEAVPLLAALATDATELPAAVIRGRGQPTPLCFVFSGNGSQHGLMGRRLYAEEPCFRQAIEAIDDTFRPLAGWSLADWFAGDRPRNLEITEVAQPVLFALQVGLVCCLREAGLQPAAVTGHSVGEVAAAWCAGMLDLHQAVQVIFHRSAVQERLRGQGTMAAIGLGLRAVAGPLVRYPGVVVAAENTPDAVTISGPQTAVQALVEELTKVGHFARVLAIDYPFHHPVLDPLQEDLVRRLDGLVPATGRCRFQSSVTGTVLHGEEVGAGYWWNNLRQPVRFRTAIEALLADGEKHFLEIGPHPILKGYLQEMSAGYEDRMVTGTLHRQAQGEDRLTEILATLYLNGHEPRWRSLAPSGAFADLPTIAFQRREYWHMPRPRVGESRAVWVHPLLGAPIPGPRPEWSASLDPVTTPWLADHRVDGAIVLPGAAMCEILLAAGRAVHQTTAMALEDLRIHRSLTLDLTETVTIRTRIEDGNRVVLASCDNEGQWILHAECRLRPLDAGEAGSDMPELAANLLTSQALYRKLSSHGLDYGPSFQAVTALEEDLGTGTSCLQGELRLPAGIDIAGLTLQPILLDAGFHLVFDLLDRHPVTAGRTYLPVRIEHLRSCGPMPERLRCLVHLHRCDGQSATADLLFTDETGSWVADCRGLRLQAIAFDFERALAEDPILYREAWQPSEAPIAALQDETRGEGTTLVLADAGGRLTTCWPQGVHTVWVEREEVSDRLAFETLLARLPSLERVIDGRSLDITGSAWDGLDDGIIAHQALIAALVATEQRPSLIVLTAGVAVPGDHDGCAQAPAWGLIGAAMNEFPDWDIRLIDCSPGGSDAHEAMALRQEILRGPGEAEVALRGERRLVPRLERGTVRTLLANPLHCGGARLRIGQPGRLESLHFVAALCPEPGPGEVRVRVHAVGLNYKDVLIAMGMLDSAVLEHGYSGMAMGLEASGVIEAVGAGVTDLHPGQAVLTFAPGTFATHLVAAAALTVPLPPGMDLNAAATMPTVMATVWYSLVEVGRVRPGETVLVHGGAGGVGLAAIQICRHLKARVIASAGTPEKRDYLHACGVTDVVDSRSLAFVDQVRECTDGAGVDVVLNSLAGEAIAQGLKLLKPYGRFLELGKRDFLADSRLGLAPFARNRSLHGIDLDQLLAERPDLVRSILDQILALVGQGILEPLPLRCFPATEIEAAFRHLQQSAHIGKVVIDLTQMPAVVPDAEAVPLARADGTYLVTGGLSGLGLETARLLARQGAGALVLCSRRGPATPGVEHTITDLEALGARVRAVAVDVADATQLAALLDEIRSSGPPLRGIYHAAMVLDDGVVANLDAERIRRVAAPKILGAELLDRLTRQDPIEHFVAFGSVAGLLSVPGQGNYNAANRFLDRLMEERQAAGLPGLAVDFPSIADVGVVARSVDLSRRPGFLQALEPMRSDRALAYLHCFLAAGCARMGLGRADWSRWPGARLARLAAQLDAATDDGGDASEMLKTSLSDADPKTRAKLIDKTVLTGLARVLGEEAGKIDRRTPLVDLGLDSLMAVEFAQHLTQATGREVPVTRLLNNTTVDRLSAWLNQGDATGSAKTTPRCLGLETAPPADRPLVVCLPPIGASATIFDSLAVSLGSSATVVPASLPAHIDRLREPPLGIEATADLIAAELLAHPRGPMLLLGISRGAPVAFAIAARLAATGHPPLAVVLAGHAGPGSESYCNGAASQFIAMTAPEASPSEEAVWSLLAQISPETQKLHGEQFQDHLQALYAMACDRRDWRPASPLPCPIVAVTASDDVFYAAKDHDHWAPYCSTFTRFDLESDHGGLSAHPGLAEVVRALCEERPLSELSQTIEPLASLARSWVSRISTGAPSVDSPQAVRKRGPGDLSAEVDSSPTV